MAANSALGGAGAAVPDPGSGRPSPGASREGIAGSGTPPASALQHPATLTQIRLWETHACSQASVIWRSWNGVEDESVTSEPLYCGSAPHPRKTLDSWLHGSFPHYIQTGAPGQPAAVGGTASIRLPIPVSG